MPMWGFWVLTTLVDPALVDPARGGTSATSLVLGVALVAAALLIVAAIGLPVLVPAGTPGVRAYARRARTAARPRLLDPDAAGRPRPRAPSAYLAAV
jgi:hypothetical protein